MKQILFFCTTLFLFFSSCSKHPEKVLPRKDGKWDYISTVKTYENGSLENTETYRGSFTFHKNGTFTFTDNGNPETGTWSASENRVTLVIDGSPIPYEVTEKKKNAETWQLNHTLTVMGVHYESRNTTRLTRSK